MPFGIYSTILRKAIHNLIHHKHCRKTNTSHTNNVIKPAFLFSMVLFSQSIVAATCPTHFYSLPLPSDASTCQQFDDAFPASLSFHSKMNLTQIKDFYTASKPALTLAQNQLGRYVIQDSNNQHRIVISKDGLGTQVDLLIINK